VSFLFQHSTIVVFFNTGHAGNLSMVPFIIYEPDKEIDTTFRLVHGCQTVDPEKVHGSMLTNFVCRRRLQ